MKKLTIATYNIQHGFGIDKKLDLRRTGQVLKSISADIIFLQEVDKFRPSSNFKNQAEFFSNFLQMYYVFGAVRKYSVGSYGNCVLSKYQINYSKNHILPDTNDTRCLLQVELLVDLKKINVFNTHLGLNQIRKRAQITDYILPLINKTTTPVVLAGDFNSPANRPEIALIKDQLIDTFDYNFGKIKYSFPSDNPTARIDFLFVNNKIIPYNSYIVEALASDHLSVVAQIDL